MPTRSGRPQIVRLPFSDYSPDQDSLTRGSVRDMSGWFPSQKGFMTFPGFINYLNTLPGQVVGSHSAAGNIAAALYNRLFYSVGGANFVSQPLSLANAANRWRFDNYGNDLIAVNGTDPNMVSTSGGTFGLLGGNPPVFSIIQATDVSIIGVVPNSQEWYSTLVDTNWTPDITTETIQAFITSTPGNITGAVQLRGGIAFFKDRALHYGTFIGPPFFWNVAVISHQVGTPAHEAVVSARDVLYFIGPDDFYTFDGYSLNTIPNNLREWFFRDINRAYLTNIVGRYDETNGPLVIWHYSSNAASPAGTLDSYVCLNIRFGTWGFGRLRIDFPLLGMAETSNGPEAGLWLPDHQLRLYDPAGAVGAPYIVTNDIGDGNYLYEVQRAKPRFNIYPATGDVELQQFYQYVPGRPNADAASPLAPGDMTPGLIQSIDQDGWFNMPTTERMQRFKLTVHDTAEIVDIALDIVEAGLV